MAVMTEEPKPARRGTGGRPSRADAALRDERMIEIAAAMFMERGFDATTIDAVAETAGVGKPTLYARYKDKNALFVAVLRRQIERWIAPLVSGLADSRRPAGSLESILLSVARDMARIALAPEAVALHRILIAQALRFPELARLSNEEGWQRSVRALAAILGDFIEGGEIEGDDPELLADLFLSLAVGRLTRAAALGLTSDPAGVERRLHAAVRVFMQGVAPR